jgi:hypothetical protein
MRKYQRYVFTAFVLISVFTLAFSDVSVAQQKKGKKPQQQGIVPVPKPPKPQKKLIITLRFNKGCRVTYPQGERIQITFRVNVDSYLTLYAIDTSGFASVLFPNQHHRDNFVKKGQLYRMPDRHYAYDLMIQGPPGTEYLEAVASTNPYYRWVFGQGVPPWYSIWGFNDSGAKNPDQMRSGIESYMVDQAPKIEGYGIAEVPKDGDLYGTATCFYQIR